MTNDTSAKIFLHLAFQIGSDLQICVQILYQRNIEYFSKRGGSGDSSKAMIADLCVPQSRVSDLSFSNQHADIISENMSKKKKSSSVHVQKSHFYDAFCTKYNYLHKDDLSSSSLLLCICKQHQPLIKAKIIWRFSRCEIFEQLRYGDQSAKNMVQCIRYDFNQEVEHISCLKTELKAYEMNHNKAGLHSAQYCSISFVGADQFSFGFSSFCSGT